VTSEPAGINCGPARQADYFRGTIVALMPVANESSRFDEWRGGRAIACLVSASSQWTVIVPQTQDLSISVAAESAIG
jgi:hypothetical protein